MDDETRKRMILKMAEAAKKNDVEAALGLIKESAALPEAFSWGTQGLRIASEEGHIEMVKALLSVSDPKAYDSQALLSAAENGHASLVEFLIPISDPRAGGSKALREAAKGGRHGIVEVLVGWGHKEEKLSEAMELAVGFGHARVVETMLAARAKTEAARVQDRDGWGGEVCGPKCALGALSLAASHGKQDLVEILAKGAPKYAAEQALACAAAAGKAQMAQWLLSNADCRDGVGKALAEAAGKGRTKVVELLMDGTDEKAKREAFEAAAWRCEYAAMEMLIDSCGGLATDSKGLECAARGGNIEWVRRLLPMSAPMDRQSHALREACWSGNVEIIKLLIPVSDAGARGQYPEDILFDLMDGELESEDSPYPKDCSMVMAAAYGGNVACLDAICDALPADEACRQLNEASDWLMEAMDEGDSGVVRRCYPRQEARLLGAVAKSGSDEPSRLRV